MDEQEIKFDDLILDATYSKALLNIALDNGYASWNGPKDLQNFVLETRTSKRYVTKALETALFFDKIIIVGMPGGIRVDKLDREGILRTTFRVGETYDFTRNIPAYFIKWIKPYIIRHIIQKQIVGLRIFGSKKLPYRITSRAFDSLIIAAEANIDFLKFRNEVLLKILDEPKLLLSPDLKYGDLAIDMIGSILREMIEDKTLKSTIQIAIIPLLSALNTIIEMWTSILTSYMFSSSLLSKHMVSSILPREAVLDNFSETYRLYRINMHEILRYAPVVESIDDVLRLRENKNIIRLRKLINNWSTNLSLGEISTSKIIVQDIKRANQELVKLDKWKRIDEWLFWIQLPVEFIPVLSNIISIASFGTGLWIRLTEKKNSWVIIGR